MSSPEITPVDNMPSTDALTARVPLHLGGNRLDKVIAELFPQYSRSRLQTWMKQGRVLVNDQPVQKSNQKVQGQDTIALSPGVLEHMQALIPEDLHLDIVGQSEDYTVVNKQAGLVVHPAPGHWTGTLMNGLYFLDPGLISVPRAGIVHRLDADTTGLMVVARTSETQVKLVQIPPVLSTLDALLPIVLTNCFAAVRRCNFILTRVFQASLRTAADR